MKFFRNQYTGASFYLVMITLALTSCEQVELRDPLEHDGTAPGMVTAIQAEALPGGAKLTYQLPKDDDLIYIQAEYEIRPGVKQEVKSSYYNNTLEILGFGDSKEHTVDIYSVDRSGNKSEKQTVKIVPATPPVQSSFELMAYESDFGGIHVSYKNEAKADLVISVLVKDANGDWVDFDKYYSALPNGDFSTRGLQAVPTTFGVFINDRWDNTSDTLVKTITPLFETLLNKTKFTALVLPGDPPNAWTLPGLWDNIPASGNGFSSVSAFPKNFQFGIGVKSKISRLKIWGVYDGREYTGGNIKEFEVWGSNSPGLDGSYDGWTLLQSCVVLRPSGENSTTLTTEDKDAAAAGFDFNIPASAPSVKYIRFKILSTFASPQNASTGATWAREVTLWGQEQP